MAIKNYTSDKALDKIFTELQQSLGKHGAKQISFDYGDDGRIHGVQFVIKVNDRLLPVKLPARVEKAQTVLKRQWEAGIISHKRGKEKAIGYEQAYRVAWRNILDWVEAQMALLEIEMVKLEEIFLPYMLNSRGETFFLRLLRKKGFYLRAVVENNLCSSEEEKWKFDLDGTTVTEKTIGKVGNYAAFCICVFRTRTLFGLTTRKWWS